MSEKRYKKKSLKLQRKFNHTFKLNEVENDKLKQLQSVTGLSVSEIVRNTLFNEQSILSSGRVQDVEELNEFRRTQIELMRLFEHEKKELNMIGNNINQIARSVNRNEDFDVEELKIIRKQIENLTSTNMEVIEQVWRQPKYIQPEI
ncbi:MobC family plasmid mobilization relaxosome protein [Staphylococcus epidermidis]|nr:MobC family plasmid mobilization relaxosome protein [Staphylococcus epidermidis]MCG2128336.1 MobC family plasmid mobilization relaxosome protein [Staphylococcus epidermidis]